MIRRFSIAEARNQLPALVHDVEDGTPVSLTRRGRPVAVLLSARDYDRLTQGRADFLTALTAFRSRHPAEFDLAEALEGTRDASPGQAFNWE